MSGGSGLKPRDVGLGWICVLVGLSLYGCAGVSRVATLPPDAGVLASYDASIEEVVEIVPQALAAVGQTEVERSRPDSSSFVLFGSRGLKRWGWGEVSRTRAAIRDEGGADVLIATRPRDLFGVWPATSQSLRVIGEMDRLLGPEAVVLAGGDRVRGVDARGNQSEGTLIAGTLGGLVLARGGGESEQLPLDSYTQLEVLRGTYSHAQEGAAIGFALGALPWLAAIGLCLDWEEGDSSSLCGRSWTYWTPVVGGVVGGLIGSVFRTAVWSRAGS